MVEEGEYKKLKQLNEQYIYAARGGRGYSGCERALHLTRNASPGCLMVEEGEYKKLKQLNEQYIHAARGGRGYSWSERALHFTRNAPPGCLMVEEGEYVLALIHISEPTRPLYNSYAAY